MTQVTSSMDHKNIYDDSRVEHISDHHDDGDQDTHPADSSDQLFLACLLYVSSNNLSSKKFGSISIRVKCISQRIVCPILF